MKEELFRKNYKKAVDQMKANEAMKRKVEQAVQVQRQEQKKPRRALYIAASIVIAAGIGLAAPSVWNQVNAPTADTEVAQVEPVAPSGSVVIPRMELPDMASGVSADMIGLVVYQNNIYTQTGTSIEAADIEALRGEKLGTTTGGIDEWSGQDAYIELASNIGTADIYAVKGYDPAFRIMSYVVADGQVYGQVYEMTNGITVSSGADLIGKLQLEGRVASAQWEGYDSWNNGLQHLQPLAKGEALDSFIAALYAAKPVETDDARVANIYDGQDRKIIYVALEDNTRVELVLFGEGFVRYSHAPVFFEVEPGVFQSFWDSLGE
ncbi:hypothetical protein PA598K_02488 [Paenibacillus sp. 598K]|uniref:hypothetical protein n=1 Tax=Paenibacillus sp. 598K TaxID=1117987 RepID=UPI000FF981A5|nr:hypothetical protein [Paenibacillus sp. 598K]GBF74157.1 hypothetical protein PA598K_02488 [Paenibacillus sp. 598K]